jgi:hypothetical protein
MNTDNPNNTEINYKFWVTGILILATALLFCGVWWGWPTTYDQHDPTRKAIQMLWNRTLDSGVRPWGNFGYQEVVLFAVVPVTALKKFFGLDPQLAEALIYLATRILWAVKALGIVGLTWITANALFNDRRTALIAMGLVVVAPGFIAWAHIPQVDMPQAFWYTVAFALTATGWRRENTRLLWFAAVAAGLAAGAKYIGGIVVLAPMVTAFLVLRTRQAIWLALALGACSVLVFAITTPLSTGAPVQWLPEFTGDLLANRHREVWKPIALWTMPGSIWDLLGPATALMGIAGVALLFTHRTPAVNRQAWVILLSCLLPYYAALAWQHVATVRYVLPLTPVLAIAIAALISRVWSLPYVGRAVKQGLAVTAVVQLILVVALVTGLTTETRDRLALWMDAHAGPDDQVETLLNHRPYFTADTDFKELTRPHFQAESFDMWTEKQNDTDSSIRRLHNIFLQWAGRDPGTLLTWVDRERIWIDRMASEFDTGIDGPVLRGSKYVVINRNTASHYVLDWPGIDPASPNEKDFYHALIGEQGPFRHVVRFESPVPEWLRYPTELWINISPTIDVYEVTG